MDSKKQKNKKFRLIIKRLLRGAAEPRVVYLILRNWAKMLQSGRVRPLYGSIFETIITPGSNPYINKFENRSENGLVISDVLDFQMFLDVTDPGLSRTLLQFGVREETSTNELRREIQQLKEIVDGKITVLDIGANIGYYTLLQATALGEKGDIYAIEPSPRNIDILEKNIEINHAGDAVSVHQKAIGDQNKETELHLAEKSNWHSIHQIEDHTDSIKIDMVDMETFLTEQGLSPDSINVIRMDVEGFEVEIFEGIDQLLSAPTPLLIFVETHPFFRDSSELNQIISKLEEYDFEIGSTALDIYGGKFDQGWYEKPVQFESFSEIKEHHENSPAAVELIASKGIK